MLKTWNEAEWVVSDPVSDTTYTSETPPDNTSWNWFDTSPQNNITVAGDAVGSVTPPAN